VANRHFMPPPTKFDPLRAQAKTASRAAPRPAVPPPIAPAARRSVPPPQPRSPLGFRPAPAGAQAKPAQPRWPPGAAPGVVQRAAPGDSKTIAEDLWESATSSGHSSSKEGEWVDLVTLKRSSLSFFSETELAKHGLTKPASGAACPNCGTATTNWELDHLNPWRPYVAALLSEDQYKVVSKKLLVQFEHVRSLYSDPGNLWYICHTCNNAKSDKIYATLDDLEADAKTVKSARPKRARTRGAGVLTVL
jgi:5-methylcytosine-specific restriction endonuclease McrA